MALVNAKPTVDRDGRVYATGRTHAHTEVEVEVEITELVDDAAKEMTDAALAKLVTIDIDATILAVLRLRNACPTARNVLDILLARIGSDALTREVRRVLD